MNSAPRMPLSHKPEVLLVEEDPQIRMFLKAMLTAEGCRIHEAADANDGLARRIQRIPDISLQSRASATGF